MKKQNFLLGKGERLIEDVVVKLGGGAKQHPYTFAEAKSRLTPKISSLASEFDLLPAGACPDDQAVASITLNPEYIAKSYYPGELFRKVGIEPVGSRPVTITPEKKSKDRETLPTFTTEYFVMGPRTAFHEWSKSIPNWSGSKGEEQLIYIEDIKQPSLSDKLKGKISKQESVVLEVVLHADELYGQNRILPLFRQYLTNIGIEANLDHRFFAGGLCFIQLDSPSDLIDKIALFTPVRAIRKMPSLRMLRPTFRASGLPSKNLALPIDNALDTNIRTAIFDGGISPNHHLSRWVNSFEVNGVGPVSAELLEHGTHVTSAYLFGHLDVNSSVPRPYSNVDHYRVLDTEPGQNPRELYDVLERIAGVLAEQKYDFINLSLGPHLPIEDDDVHAWTAVLDDRLGRSQTLATIAVGNDGEGDSELGLNRVQVPSDCVNALAVGACDSPDLDWKRAPYSSVGPGRSPGLIKPDLVDFGGAIQRPFLVVDSGDELLFGSTGGTSFAAPSVLRLAAGIKSHLGSGLSNLTIKALLIHTAESNKLPFYEVGRGRVARALEDILLCDDDTVRLVYQGIISPTRYVRAPIPFPNELISGKVKITATLCYNTITDPHHPGNYTRAGLEVSFRPHDQKRSKSEQLHPDTKGFFGKAQTGLSEEELRRDALKWENCLHAQVGFQGSSLRNPVFDIHYNSRLEGRNFNPSNELNYSLVVTVQSKSVADLYDKVVRRYSTQIEPLRPLIEIPIR